jgi:hypothetical protein
VGIVRANYVPMAAGAAAPASRRRISRAMEYYTFRPGADLEAAREPGGRAARAWHTPDGERVSRREAAARVEGWLRERGGEPAPRCYRIVLSTRAVELTAADVAATLRRGLERGGRDSRALEQWAYCRHDAGEHPHVHVVALTDHRGLNTADLAAMRAVVEERERLREREREQALARDRALAAPEHDHAMEDLW